ncbi:MAG: methyl-accepting chemotaxis protein [Candidatus Binatia bacterium]
MFKLQNIAVGKKLFILSAVLLTATVAVWIAGQRGINQLHALVGVSEQQLDAARAISTVERTHDGLRAVVFRVLIATEMGEEHERTEARGELSLYADTLLGALDTLAGLPIQEDIQQSLATTRTNVTTYITAAQEIGEIAVSGKLNLARMDLPRLQAEFQKSSEALQELGLLVRGNASWSQTQSEESAQKATRDSIIALVLAIALALTLGWLITRSITLPLRKMTIVAAQLATGDVSQHLSYQSRDEIGALATAFGTLIQYIQNLAKAAEIVSKGDLTVQIIPQSEHDILAWSFARMVDNLRAMNRQIQDGTKVLTSSISQILASVSQLTVSTTETATAVRQTATTLEEVKQIAHTANSKAKELALRGESAVTTSQKGEQALEQASTGLNHIRGQMESIANGVLGLGEYSRAISDIIDSVNSIADQSSLLALNAAIEAAKAGDRGKGFTVVSQEVRNLASQSRHATAEIETILNNIRKAVNTAILVTEQGTKSVQVGVSQSLEAGESFQYLAQSVNEVAQAMTMLATSSEQQLLGLTQVVTAMADIQRASNQSAEGMGEIKDAAKTLHGVGQTLQAVVEQYKLTPDEIH